MKNVMMFVEGKEQFKDDYIHSWKRFFNSGVEVTVFGSIGEAISSAEKTNYNLAMIHCANNSAPEGIFLGRELREIGYSGKIILATVDSSADSRKRLESVKGDISYMFMPVARFDMRTVVPEVCA
jgi:hypothetical protein